MQIGVNSSVENRLIESEVEDASCVVDGAWILHNIFTEAHWDQGTDLRAGAENSSHSLFFKVMNEVVLREVSHKGGLVPRLMAIQGVVRDGKLPCYRHPLDDDLPILPFTAVVSALRRALITRMGREGFVLDEDGDFNHALIQLYRSGHDYISEHADKTIDIKPNSYIVNVSLGATRTLVLREKKAKEGASRKAIRVPLRSGSASY